MKIDQIQKVEAKENHLLLITFADGESGIFDVKPYLSYEAFKTLNNSSEFKKIQNGGYYVEWESGADLSADTLRAHLQKKDIAALTEKGS